ncbi:hypothetical protein ALC56_02868, partial [Trachymyrmex septentrionalis]
VSKYKTIFEKDYTPNWTIEITIIKVQRINPVTYLLNLDVANIMRCRQHVKNCALQNVLKIYNWWLQKNILNKNTVTSGGLARLFSFVEIWKSSKH